MLWDEGEKDLARRRLWQRTAPSWFYAVGHGATTSWEGGGQKRRHADCEFLQRLRFRVRG
ncbi:MAG: hypothetical protein ACO1O4_07190 [Devosia sp.]